MQEERLLKLISSQSEKDRKIALPMKIKGGRGGPLRIIALLP